MNLTIDNPLPHFNEKSIPLKKAFTLTQQAIGQDLEITLIFTSEDDMFNLNNQLRSKPTPTDVLSLPLEENKGEIFLCPDFIFNQGYGNDRILHLWIHGLLHIAGHTHDHENDFKAMSKLEIDICKQLGLKNPYGE